VKAKIVLAYEAASHGNSVDRVVCDPELNSAFLAECEKQGLSGAPATLNRALLNLRKAGYLRGLKSRSTSVGNDDAYRFSAEMAVRYMERRDGVTLDDIICDPDLAAEFHKIAETISPGFSPLQYAWAALNLRKAKRLSPELLARVAPPKLVLSLPVSGLSLDAIPTEQGLYLFFTSESCLYVGEAESLRNRIGKHLDHSDNKGLARWMWDQGETKLFLEMQVLEPATTQKIRRALECELIRGRRPLFKVKR
jgi:site-specific DNA-methyltransferase (adenine-specific)